MAEQPCRVPVQRSVGDDRWKQFRFHRPTMRPRDAAHPTSAGKSDWHAGSRFEREIAIHRERLSSRRFAQPVRDPRENQLHLSFRQRRLIGRHPRFGVFVRNRLIEQAGTRTSGDHGLPTAAPLEDRLEVLEIQARLLLIVSMTLQAVLPKDRLDVIVVIDRGFLIGEGHRGQTDQSEGDELLHDFNSVSNVTCDNQRRDDVPASS